MPDALYEFGCEAEKIIASFVTTLTEEPPEIVYHYTNVVGLRGILETGQLWLTDIFDLNDPSELSHGFAIANNVLSSNVAGCGPETKKFAQGLQGFYKRVGIEGSAQYFICSFTSCGDDLGQWRAYADNGRGFALGFDGKALEAGFAKNGFNNDGVPNTDTFPITYNDGRLAEIDCEIIESFRRMLDLESILQSGPSIEDMAALYTSFTVPLLRASTFFKHPAYDNEKEYGFLQTYVFNEVVPGLKRKARRYSLVKYKEFDWRSAAPTALKRIIIGPAADAEKAQQFARDCLHLFHPEAAPVTCSGTPYRAV